MNTNRTTAPISNGRKKNNTRSLLLTEALLILLLMVVMTLLLYQKDPRPDVTETEVVEMFESMAEDASVLPGGTLRLRRVFGLNAADYDLMVYYMPKETMDVCEFLLIRADESTIDSVRSAMETRIASQLAAFDHYGEHQTELLNEAVIESFGNYICLIVSKTPDEWLTAVKALLEV